MVMPILLDVLPYFTKRYLGDGSFRYAVAFREDGKRHPFRPQAANVQHNFGSKFCGAVLFAACHAIWAQACRMVIALPLATSLHHIAGVVGIRAKHQMFGVDAGRVVAAMSHNQPLGDWPDKQLISEAVRPHDFAMDAKFAVAILCDVASVEPAMGSFFDPGEEDRFVIKGSVLQLLLRLCGTGLGAETPTPVFDLTCGGEECLVAPLALANDVGASGVRYDRIRVHQNLHRSGAMPLAGTNSAGAFPNFTTKEMPWLLL